MFVATHKKSPITVPHKMVLRFTFRFVMIMNGTRNVAPIRVLIPIKVNGSTDFDPTLWETNEDPQIIAVIRRIITPLKLVSGCVLSVVFSLLIMILL